MFPFVFEWVWDMSHIVFMGGLHFALAVMSLGMAYCLLKAAYDTIKGNGDEHH